MNIFRHYLFSKLERPPGEYVSCGVPMLIFIKPYLGRYVWNTETFVWNTYGTLGIRMEHGLWNTYGTFVEYSWNDHIE